MSDKATVMLRFSVEEVMLPLAKVILGVSESANSVFVPLRSSMQKNFTGPAAFAPKGMSKHPNRNNLIRLLFIVD